MAQHNPLMKSIAVHHMYSLRLPFELLEQLIFFQDSSFTLWL